MCATIACQYSYRGRRVTDRGVAAQKVLRGFQRFSEVFRDFQRFLDFLFEMVKKVLRSAEQFSEPLLLSPLPLYPAPTYIVGTSCRGDILLSPRSPRKCRYLLFAYTLFKSGESNRPLTPILLKSIAIQLPFLSRYFCTSMLSSWQKVVLREK